MWRNRNTLLFENTTCTPEILLERAGFWLHQYKSAQKISSRCEGQSLEPQPPDKWQKPSPGTLKLNVDAAVIRGSGFIGAGGIVRNDEGKVLGAFSVKFPGFFDVLLGELVALRTGLSFAHDSGFNISEVEGDSLNAIRAVTGLPSPDHAGTMANDIRRLLALTGGGSCKYVPRSGNKVAHHLARMAYSVNDDCFWQEDYPPNIHKYVMADLASV